MRAQGDRQVGSGPARHRTAGGTPGRGASGSTARRAAGQRAPAGARGRCGDRDCRHQRLGGGSVPGVGTDWNASSSWGSDSCGAGAAVGPPPASSQGRGLMSAAFWFGVVVFLAVPVVIAGRRLHLAAGTQPRTSSRTHRVDRSRSERRRPSRCDQVVFADELLTTSPLASLPVVGTTVRVGHPPPRFCTAVNEGLPVISRHFGSRGSVGRSRSSQADSSPSRPDTRIPPWSGSVGSPVVLSAEPSPNTFRTCALHDRAPDSTSPERVFP
jgi:hypothetical protein